MKTSPRADIAIGQVADFVTIGKILKIPRPAAEVDSMVFSPSVSLGERPDPYSGEPWSVGRPSVSVGDRGMTQPRARAWLWILMIALSMSSTACAQLPAAGGAAGAAGAASGAAGSA